MVPTERTHSVRAFFIDCYAVSKNSRAVHILPLAEVLKVFERRSLIEITTIATILSAPHSTGTAFRRMLGSICQLRCKKRCRSTVLNYSTFAYIFLACLCSPLGTYLLSACSFLLCTDTIQESDLAS